MNPKFLKVLQEGVGIIPRQLMVTVEKQRVRPVLSRTHPLIDILHIIVSFLQVVCPVQGVAGGGVLHLLMVDHSSLTPVPEDDVSFFFFIYRLTSVPSARTGSPTPSWITGRPGVVLRGRANGYVSG